MKTPHNDTNKLIEFVSALKYEQLPDLVIDRTEELFLDWLGSALAAKNLHPIPAFMKVAKLMGPADGGSEILCDRTFTSPYFASWLNAASSHLVEQDDLHNSSVFHPATVIFPAALAVAQSLGSSGRDLITACVAGYETGIRIGEFFGRTHYRIFHTTATVGTIAASVAASHLLKLSEQQMVHAVGTSGTQAAGLWQFLADAADSKQVHTAHAAATGVMSAYLAQSGVTGAKQILEGDKGLAAGMSSDSDPRCLSNKLGKRWALLETSFKYHASCRHTHPAADALLDLIQRENISYQSIVKVTANVHQDAINVLGAVGVPETVHQAKFSMGTVLALIAIYQKAGIEEFRDHALGDQRVSDFCCLVEMKLSSEVDQAYPKNWLGRIEITLKDGRKLTGSTDYPLGDPENTLSRTMLENKVHRLVRFSKAASAKEVESLIKQAWNLRKTKVIKSMLTKKSREETS